MQKGTEFIKNTHADARDFEYIGTKDFFEGKITKIQFKYEQQQTGLNLIYDHDGKLHYFRNPEQLVDHLGAIKRKNFIVTLLSSDYVPGVMAIVFLVIIAIYLLVLRENKLPDIIANTFTLVIGYYFGRGIQRPRAFPTE